MQCSECIVGKFFFQIKRPKIFCPYLCSGDPDRRPQAGTVVLDNPRINVTAVKRMEIKQLQLSGGVRSGGQEVG